MHSPFPRPASSPFPPFRPQTCRAVAATAWLVLTLAACAPNGLTGQTRHAGFYSAALVAAAAADGGIPLLVRGDPSAASPAIDATALNEAVAVALPPPSWLTLARYRPLRADAPATPYRLVLLFDPAATTPGGDEVCVEPLTQPLAPAVGASTRVQATFCVGNRVASSVLATGRRPADIRDAAFRRLMDPVIEALLPVVNPAASRSGGGGG